MKQMDVFDEARIGKRIKSLRNEKKITLEKLAAQTGFTKGYLSRVEKSVKAPPVSTLAIIARILNVTISTLLGEETPPSSVCVVRKTERLEVVRDGSNNEYAYEALAHNFRNKIMEPFILTLPVRPKRRILYRHEGQEMLYVLEGTMKLRCGNEEIIAGEGDCVYFDSGIPHFGESISDKAVKCLMVASSPDAA
jgi:transcriptional regulator with XRE-family HTH domain